MDLEQNISISVVIPAYNSAGTIEAALESVVAQGVAGIEVIIVDDASTDSTVEIVRDWARKTIDNRPLTIDRDEEDISQSRNSTTQQPNNSPALQVLVQDKNLGPAAARNRGIAEAVSPWIAFLDGDDEWLPGKLALQLKLAAEHPEVDLWCGAVQSTGGKGSINHGLTQMNTDEGRDGKRQDLQAEPESPAALLDGEDGGEEDSSQLTTQQPSNSTTGQLFTELTLDDFITANPVATSTVMVRKSVLDEVGGFDEQFRGPEDYDLWLRIAGRKLTTDITDKDNASPCSMLSAPCNSRMARINAPLARYRSEAGSLSMDDRKFLPQVLRALDKAFGNGGALECFGDKKDLAVANQYWNVSWMAFNRGSRVDAIRMLLKGWRLSKSRLSLARHQSKHDAGQAPRAEGMTLRQAQDLRCASRGDADLDGASSSGRVAHEVNIRERPWWRLLARYVFGKI